MSHVPQREATSASPGRSEFGVQVVGEGGECADTARVVAFSRVSIGPQRMDCLEQLGETFLSELEASKNKSWTVTWQHMVKSKMSRICPGEHLTQGVPRRFLQGCS